jgi:HEAT repeat protein
VVSGEIGSDPLDDLLKDPTQRLKTATDVLQGRVGGDLSKVFDALDDFDNDELLALLPDLSDLGARAVPGLLPKLNSERREVRQAAVILLGMALDPDALEPLSELLIRERSNVWLDVARALGAYGPVALRRLCQTLNRYTGRSDEANAIERVARALAEIALSDGQVGPGDPSPGHDALSALADSGDPRVSAAARRALATLRDVSESGAAIRGEMPLSEVTQVRGFARRAYEAIMVPEVEVEVEV